jgi:hypothetical protein
MDPSGSLYQRTGYYTTKEKTTHSGGLLFCCSREPGFFTTPCAAALRRHREWVSAAKRTQCVLFASVSRKQEVRQGALAAPKPHDYVFGRVMKNPIKQGVCRAGAGDARDYQ